MSISPGIDLPELPVAFMNEDHAHAAEQWREMASALAEYPARPARLVAACDAFLRHNREHFEREEAAMLSSGFPPYPVHKQEHDRVLAWIEELLDSIRAGEDPALLHDVIQRDLLAWLQQHVQTMDLVTARWIASRN